MALEENSNGMFTMPVAPYGGGFGNGFGNGDGSWWILLLFILLGGWGNGFGGYGNGGGTAFVDNSVQRGFDQSAIMSGINSINNNVVGGFGDVQNALCAGFNGVEIAANSRQMADMNQMFNLQSQLASCCCENRLGTADLKYTIATEACADRSAVTSALEAVIANQTANTQKIIDMMCQDKIDSKNEKIVELQNAINMANLQASQVAQTAEIISKLPAATTAGA